MWGCRPHWFTLPKPLRDRIWATYRPGQEVTKTPSPAYLEAAHAVQAWIAQQAQIPPKPQPNAWHIEPSTHKARSGRERRTYRVARGDGPQKQYVLDGWGDEPHVYKNHYEAMQIRDELNADGSRP